MVCALSGVICHCHVHAYKDVEWILEEVVTTFYICLTILYCTVCIYLPIAL